MSTNRRSRILVLLAERPMNIVSLTNELNKRFDKGYAPSLIGGDVKTLMVSHLVKIDDDKCFSLTGLGIVQSDMDAEEVRLDSQRNQAQTEQV